MGINVKAKVDFNTIIEKLHKVAKDFAENKSGKKIELDNLAFDDQNGKFLGSGEFCIFMKQKDGGVTEKDRSRFFEVIKEYVHYFVGEESVKYIEEDSLQPLYMGSTGNPEQEEKEAEQKKKDAEDNEKSAKINSDLEKRQEEQGLEESVFLSKRNDKLIKMLFEDEKNGDSPNIDNDKQKEDTNQEKCIGYGVAYSIDINGKTDWTIGKALSNKAKGLFGGILADLRNIKIKIGGEPVNLGHVFDPDKWKELIGMKDIDITQVKQALEAAFKNDYRNNTLEISVEDKDWLISKLNRNGKLSPQIKSKINSANYSVLIQANEEDPHYPKYTQKSIAKTASKAFGTTYNAGVDWNAVSKEDVIKIDDTKKANGSNYKKEKDDKSITDRIRDMLSKEGNKTKKQEKKTTNESAITKSENDSGDNNTDNGKDNEKKDSRLSVIQSEEYSKAINENLSQQNEKILKKLGESVDTQFVTMDECVNILNKSGINDQEFINDVKETKQNCIVTNITKDFSKTLKESEDVIQGLLRKYDIDNGLIVESEEEKSEREITDEVIDKQNPHQDANLDKEYHVNAKKRIDSQDAILNSVQKMSGEVQKAFKNVFLIAKDKFQELKDTKPQFKMYQTSMELEDDNKKNESLETVYGHKLLSLLFEGEGENSPWNANLDSERLEIINCALIGGVSRISHWYEKDDTEQDKEPEEGENQNQVKESENTGRREKPEPKEGERDESTYEEAPQKNFGSRQHITPYCVVSETENVINYMKNHNIGNDSEYGKMRGAVNEAKNPERLKDAEGGHNPENDKNQYKYCAIVIKKHALMKDGKVQVFGGAGHESLDDQSVQKMLDSIIGHNADVGEDYKIGMIHCEDQNEKTMNAQKGELLEQNLAYHNEKGKGLVPVLDVWVRPFNLKDKDNDSDNNRKKSEGDKFNILLMQMQQMINKISIQNNIKVVVGGGDSDKNPIPPSLNVKMKFIFIMPDPIVIAITGEDGVPPPPPGPQPGGDKNPKKNEGIVDWYIIPHKAIKDMGDRNMQHSTDSHGITTTATSNKEYKPNDK